MNIESINAVADQIEREWQHYRQDSWLGSPDLRYCQLTSEELWADRHKCGTVACIDGTACAMANSLDANPNDLFGLEPSFGNEWGMYNSTGVCWPAPYGDMFIQAKGDHQLEAKAAAELLRAIARGEITE